MTYNHKSRAKLYQQFYSKIGSYKLEQKNKITPNPDRINSIIQTNYNTSIRYTKRKKKKKSSIHQTKGKLSIQIELQQEIQNSQLHNPTLCSSNNGQLKNRYYLISRSSS